MGTRLDQLLDRIAPPRTIDETASRTDRALNSFRLKTALITDWEEFKACTAEFYCHVENTVLRLNPRRSVDLEFDWSRASRLYEREYGSSGEKAAFEIARTGNEGGLYAALKALARRMAEEYAGNEISARISRFLGELSVDEHLAMADEYLEKFGHLLPSELTDGSAARIRANMAKVLEEHPRLVRALRQVGR